MAEEKVLLQIEGMTCDGCASTIEGSLTRNKGVKAVQVDWRSGVGEITFDTPETDEQKILKSPVFQYAYEAWAIPPAGCC